MALKATIHRVSLQIADMDRHYYQDHNLTIARHPSETDERMMVRLFAFALHADENLQFTKGLCVDNEPDLWLKNFTNDIELWIDVGLPDENRVRKACGKAGQVIVYCYGGRSAQVWWERNAAKLSRFKNLQIISFSAKSTSELANLSQRSMDLHCSIQDGQVCIGDDSHSFNIVPHYFLQTKR